MPISQLYIDREVETLPETISVRDRVKAASVSVADADEVFRVLSESTDDPVQKGKETLFLTRNKGAFIRKCPGTRHYTCCGYQILHIGNFCTMDCSYCILQSYFHPPVLQYFVNRRDMLRELKCMFAEKIIRRIGTGEFTDSLIWEQWSDLSAVLVQEFAGQSSAVLELKTKTVAVAGLKSLCHNRKTVASWSLNTPAVISSEERRTSSLDARLEAAAKCESYGYPLAFHFDPMVIYEGCEDEYVRVAEKLFSRVSADNIAWISLGTFRFMPALKAIIRQRFPDSKIVFGEFISGLDGKMRYFKPLRISLYRKLASRIHEIAPRVLVYLCMEDEDVWEKSLGFKPSDRGGLCAMLDDAAARLCGLS